MLVVFFLPRRRDTSECSLPKTTHTRMTRRVNKTRFFLFSITRYAEIGIYIEYCKVSVNIRRFFFFFIIIICLSIALKSISSEKFIRVFCRSIAVIDTFFFLRNISPCNVPETITTNLESWNTFMWLFRFPAIYNTQRFRGNQIDFLSCWGLKI